MHYMLQYHMTMPGDLVIAGVSGGADSVCLLLALAGLRERLGISLEVVHVHHGLREEADAEEAYVRKLCGKLEVPCLVTHGNALVLAKQEGVSCEEAGRLLRYRAFEEAGRHAGRRVRIAVAHHQNDCAETVLFHLFRGSGMTGLTGIRPVRDNIIRPLLCVSREEIENWLQKKNVSYCMDASNDGDAYTRNRIRHDILPYAEQHICKGSTRHIAETARLAAETEEFLELLSETAYAACLCPQEETQTEAEKILLKLSVDRLLEEHPVMRKRILLRALKQISMAGKDIAAVHMEALMALLLKEESSELSLPYGLTAQKEYGDLLFYRCRNRRENGVEERAEVPEKEYPAAVPGEILLDDGKILRFELLSGEKAKNIPQKTYTKWFDYDKIEKSLMVRTRRTGDYLTVDSALSRQTLKKYMIQEKIPARFRDRMYVLADGSHIVWVIGHRISQRYKVSEHTKAILQVQVEERN